MPRPLSGTRTSAPSSHSQCWSAGKARTSCCATCASALSPRRGRLRPCRGEPDSTQRPGGPEDTEGVAEPRALALSQLSPLETNPQDAGIRLEALPTPARPPASHPRQPAARAASAPPGGPPWSRRARALAATAARGSSEIGLPSSPGTSRNPTVRGKKIQVTRKRSSEDGDHSRGGAPRIWGAQLRNKKLLTTASP